MDGKNLGRVVRIAVAGWAIISAAANAAAQETFAGTWRGDGVLLVLAQQSATEYRGELTWLGRKLPLNGQIEDGVFFGEATLDGTRYSYLVERDGPGIRFTIDSQVYALTRTSAVDSQTAAPASPTPAGIVPGNPAGLSRPVALMLSPTPIQDTQGWVGGTAGTMLMPAGWRADAHVQWFLHPTMPGRIAFRTVSPDSRTTIALLPHRMFVQGPMVVRMPEYYGNTVAAPVGSAGALIRRVLLPELHGTRAWREVESQPLPDLARCVAELNQHPMARSSADGLRLRIAYEHDGKAQIDDVFAIYAVQEIGSVTYWQGLYLVTVTSDPAGIEAATALVPALLQSIQIELPWFNKMQQISDAFQRAMLENVALAGRQSQIIRELSHQVSENRRATYANMSRSLDQTMDRFSEYVRGTETWQNHHGQSVTLPSGYRQAWQSDNGTILVSDNPNLNPNTDHGTREHNWHVMRR